MSTATPTDSVEKNIDMAFDFARAVVDDPSILDTIPDSATIVPVPDDDPELADHNIQMGIRAVRSGDDVYFLHVKKSESSP